MSGIWLNDLLDATGAEGAAVRVTVIRAEGSAPRGPGAAMTVWADRFDGTIGGGELEHQALHTARALLTDENDGAWRREVRRYPLGPSLGQCCGGRVGLLYEVFRAEEGAALNQDSFGEESLAVRPLVSGTALELVQERKQDRDGWPLGVRRAVREMCAGIRHRETLVIDGYLIEPLARTLAPLFLYGAGHVGRAAVKVLSDLPFHVYWVDTARARYPDDMPPDVEPVIATDPARIAAHAPDGAWHVVMTFSHGLDLDICRQVLSGNGFAYLGVIASKTKRARFVRRLRDEGIADSVLAGLHAPIGLSGITGKEPASIAVSLAADLLIRLEAQRRAAKPDNVFRTEEKQ